MSIEIIFGQNESEQNRMTKTITHTGTFTGLLKDGCSVEKPVLLMQGDPAVFAEFNYFTIPTFRRSYFITDATVLSSNLISITGRCDVLVSFKDQILNNNAIISKQENKWNLYLNDGTFATYQNEIVITKRVGSGTYPFGNYNYILTVAGG